MAANGVAEKFTREERDRFEALLLDRRRELMKDMLALEEAEARDASDHSAQTTHLADLGSDRAASDVSLGRRESESTEIQEIDDAMERLRDATFGFCEICGQSVSRERLLAIPYTRLCLPCKKQEEA